MAKADRARIDYMPCPAALQAICGAQQLYPDHNTQALIDRLVITGLSALTQAHWQPPRLYGRDRDRWSVPDDLTGQNSGRFCFK